eukprot:11108727-Alexandrium_andersonii.AAC.1
MASGVGEPAGPGMAAPGAPGQRGERARGTRALASGERWPMCGKVSCVRCGRNLHREYARSPL